MQTSYMLKNYFKIAFRNIIRHKAYSILNISGLAIGMAASILILLWVQNELSYDRFNENADRTYRITANAGDFKAAVNPPGMPAGLQAEMPVIKKTVRLSHLSTNVLETDNRKFTEKRVFWADSTFLDVFSYPLIEGDRATALQRADGLLITADLEKKYFGREKALGKTMKLDNDDLVTVTGVLANIPSNSHLQFDVIIPLAADYKNNDILRNSSWGNFNYYSYVVLDPHFDANPASLARLEGQMNTIFKKHVGEDKLKAGFHLQPLTSIHLQSNLQVDLPGHGNIQYVNVLFIVAIFILVLACINFMNLATARSARRAKEVGLRKVVGAQRGQLIGQFLGESMLISLLALLLAIGLVWLSLPGFNLLAQKKLAIHLLDGKVLLMLLGIALATGLVAGSYPAFFLSGFQPVKVLKGSLRSLAGNMLFRNGLVVVQFVVSIVLLVGTVVVYNQLHYIRNRNMGFDKANLLYMPMTGDLWQKFSVLKTELERDPMTHDYTVVSELPVNIISGSPDAEWEGKDPNAQVVIPSIDVTEGFIDVFHMKLLNGRGFSKDFKADSNNFVINETAVRLMGMTVANAVGKSLTYQHRKGVIIGVVKDFNFKPVQIAIEPLVLRLMQYGGTVVVRAQPGKTEATIAALGRISQRLNPAYPFSFDFLDQDLANLYKGEQQMSSIFNLFAALAIFISCLGLYGLSAFMAQQRTKEIGVRKVLGASPFTIVYLLSTGFTRLIIVAMIIAIPLSWFVIHRWLEGFAYHVEVGWGVFAAAPVAALFIAWATVSYESLKAALMNPIKSLKIE
jgi:predicted permease